MERLSQQYDAAQLDRVIRELGRELSSPLILPVLYAAPDKPKDGQIVYADGTTWDPGSGEGIYCYYNSAWNYLG